MKFSDSPREYHRIYALQAYHKRRAAIVKRVTPESTCELCPSPFRRVIPVVLVWRDDRAAKKAQSLGVPRTNYLATTRKTTREKILAAGLVQALCMHHARTKLWRKGQITHGTYWSSYKCKCVCDECGEYRADYALRRREDRRARKEKP